MCCPPRPSRVGTAVHGGTRSWGSRIRTGRNAHGMLRLAAQTFFQTARAGDDEHAGSRQRPGVVTSSRRRTRRGESRKNRVNNSWSTGTRSPSGRGFLVLAPADGVGTQPPHCRSTSLSWASIQSEAAMRMSREKGLGWITCRCRLRKRGRLCSPMRLTVRPTRNGELCPLRSFRATSASAPRSCPAIRLAALPTSSLVTGP